MSGEIAPGWGKIRLELTRRRYLAAIILLVAPYLMAAGFFLRKMELKAASAPNAAPVTATNGAGDAFLPCHPGPWGELDYIETPEEFLSVRSFEATDSRWFFGGLTRESALAFLGQAGLIGEQKKELADAKWETATNGVYVTPPENVITSLNPETREKIYNKLAQNNENSSQQDVFFFPPDKLDGIFDKSGVAPETVALVKKLCYPHGKLLFFADIPLVLRGLPHYEDKMRLAKTVSRRPTLLMRLHINSGTNIKNLLSYWAKAGQEKDLRPLLESLAQVEGGARMSLINLLPPVPSARLYSFPYPSLEPLEHDNCHWTSFNFFKDPPDNRFMDGKFIRQALDTEYSQVTSDYRYGDVVLLTESSGEIIHSAVYIADNIVYTKNGGHFLSPWMLMAIPDMLDAFSAMLPPEESLKVVCYRNRTL